MDNSASRQKIGLAKKIVFIALQVLFACIAIALAVWQIGKYTNSLRSEDLIDNLPWLILSGLLYVVFYGVLSMHWQYICRHIEPKISKYQWLALFAAQPYKYLPTSIFSLTFRAKYAKELGMKVKKSSLAQFVENVSMLASAASIAVLVWLTMHGYGLLGVVGFFAGFGLFVVGFEALARIKYGSHFPLKKRIIIFLLSALAWVTAGIAFFIVLLTFHEKIGLFDAIGANAAAVEAGIVAIFAPGGVGVRELVFSFFSVGAIVIIGWRLVTVVVDVVIGPVAWYLIKRLK